MKSTIITIIQSLVVRLSKVKFFRVMFEVGYDSLRNLQKKVSYKKNEFIFNTPNKLNDFRANSFSTKEPETLEWIDNLPKQSVMWDIGANVGLYSVYAAKTRDARVYAFEPSVFNLELLARNIYLNNLIHQITIIPLPLNDRLSISNMQLTTLEQGGALSTFEHNVGFNGKKIEKVFEYGMIGVSMDMVVENFGIPIPDYIKMDVDGIEHFILSGGPKVLSKVKGLIIEINEDFQEQYNKSTTLLENAGLKLIEKRHGEIFDQLDSLFKNCFNQIWVREN